MHACLHVCMCMCVYVCMYVCTYVRTYVCMYVCMYVRTYVRTYVCMYVCIEEHVCFELEQILTIAYSGKKQNNNQTKHVILVSLPNVGNYCWILTFLDKKITARHWFSQSMSLTEWPGMNYQHFHKARLWQGNPAWINLAFTKHGFG